MYTAHRETTLSPQLLRERARNSYPVPSDSNVGSTDPNPHPPEAEDPDDELFLLGERIADLAVRINAAEHEMLTLIAHFDERRGWAEAGFASCADWPDAEIGK